MSSPTVICFDTGSPHVFWCTFCHRWHFHSREDGHRVAHCHNSHSPYQESGYVLRCIGTAPPEALKDMRSRRPLLEGRT